MRRRAEYGQLPQCARRHDAGHSRAAPQAHARSVTPLPVHVLETGQPHPYSISYRGPVRQPRIAQQESPPRNRRTPHAAEFPEGASRRATDRIPGAFPRYRGTRSSVVRLLHALRTPQRYALLDRAALDVRLAAARAGASPTRHAGLIQRGACALRASRFARGPSSAPVPHRPGMKVTIFTLPSPRPHRQRRRVESAVRGTSAAPERVVVRGCATAPSIRPSGSNMRSWTRARPEWRRALPRIGSRARSIVVVLVSRAPDEPRPSNPGSAAYLPVTIPHPVEELCSTIAGALSRAGASCAANGAIW